MKQSVFEKLPVVMSEAAQVVELMEAYPLKKHWYRRINDMCASLDSAFEKLEHTAEYVAFEKKVQEFETLMYKVKAMQSVKKPRLKR